MIQSITDKMKASDSLHSQNSSLFYQGSCFARSSFNLFSCSSLDQLYLRPADWAGDWLGMVAPVKRIRVFGSAVLTHDETGHRGFLPVVGEGFDDCIARAAIGAVDEGIAEPSIRGIQHFLAAVRANRDIRRDEYKTFFLL